MGVGDSKGGVGTGSGGSDLGFTFEEGRGLGREVAVVEGPACGRSMARKSCFSLAFGAVEAGVALATGTRPYG